MIITAVACPLVLNNTCLSGITSNNTITPIRFRMFLCLKLSFFCIDKPSLSGNKELVDKGQIFLHKPVATTNKAGATGIRIFQNKVIPKEGKNRRRNRKVHPTNQNIN